MIAYAGLQRLKAGEQEYCQVVGGHRFNFHKYLFGEFKDSFTFFA